MKNTIKLTAVALLALSFLPRIASAHDDEENRGEPVYQGHNSRPDYNDRRGFRHRGGGELEREIDHLNGMLAHVRDSMQRYDASRHVRREYLHLEAEVNQIGRQFRRGEQYYNRERLLGEVRHMHEELHHIEQELHVPSQSYFQWGG